MHESGERRQRHAADWACAGDPRAGPRDALVARRIQAQLETLHQLECGAAALRSALGAAPDGTPRDLASELKLLGKAHRGLPGAPPPTAINAREPEARIRKIVELCAPAPGKTAAAR